MDLAFPKPVHDAVPAIAALACSPGPLLRERAANVLGRIGRADCHAIEPYRAGPGHRRGGVARTNEEPRTIRGTTKPFARIYFTYGSCLFEAQRYDKAIEACNKAIRWNPADVGLRFELGENYKRLGDMKSYERILSELYPYVATAADLAHYHRAMGYLHIELGNYRLAAAHLMVSLLFENSSLPLSEVMYIKMQYGQDYTGMEPQDALDVLREAGEKVFPDEDTFDALNQLLNMSFRHGDYQTTLETAIELYNFTREEEYENIARRLMEALDGGSEEDEDR